MQFFFLFHATNKCLFLLILKLRNRSRMFILLFTKLICRYIAAEVEYLLSPKIAYAHLPHTTFYRNAEAFHYG